MNDTTLGQQVAKANNCWIQKEVATGQMLKKTKEQIANEIFGLKEMNLLGKV